MIGRKFPLALVVSSAVCLPTQAGEVSFTGIGFLQEHSPPPQSFGTGVSPDGGTVLGNASSPPNFSIASVRWTRQAGLQSLGVPPGVTFSTASAASLGADVIAGYHQNSQRYMGYRWTESGGYVDLGDLPGGSNSTLALDMSWDGNTIVGTGNYGFFPGTPLHGEGFVWTAAGGIRSVGFLKGGTVSQALAVTADGRITVGVADDPNGGYAFTWTEQGGMSLLPDLPGGTTDAIAGEISSNGRFIVGRGHSNRGYEACLWTDAGTPIGLGDLPGGPFLSYAEGVTDDGALIVGYSSIASTSDRAFIWDAAHGMRDLRTVLRTQFGLPLTGWTLTRANAISPDGTVIAGDGINPRGDFEGWVAVIPEPGASSAVLLGLAIVRVTRFRRR
jgi:probable HAF family extracellular repeat protein